MEAKVSDSRSVLKKVHKVRESLNDHFIEREDEVDSLLAAFLCKEHVVLVGSPGTAKSQLAKAFLRHFKGVRKFKTILDSDSRKEDLFGTPDPRKMREKGVVHFRLERGFADCTYAFIDETFDAPTGVLRSMMDVLLDREFRNHTQYKKCPLRTAIFSSNVYKDYEGYEAFVDRILFRHVVQEVSHSNIPRLLMMNRRYTPKVFLYPEDVEALDSLVRKVRIPAKLLYKLELYKKRYDASDGPSVSNRRLPAVINAIRAFTVLRGGCIANEDDVNKATRVLFVVGDQESAVAYASAKSSADSGYSASLRTSDGEDIVDTLRDLFLLWRETFSALQKGESTVAADNGVSVNVASVFDHVVEFMYSENVLTRTLNRLSSYGVFAEDIDGTLRRVDNIARELHRLVNNRISDPAELYSAFVEFPEYEETLNPNLVPEQCYV